MVSKVNIFCCLAGGLCPDHIDTLKMDGILETPSDFLWHIVNLDNYILITLLVKCRYRAAVHEKVSVTTNVSNMINSGAVSQNEIPVAVKTGTICNYF